MVRYAILFLVSIFSVVTIGFADHVPRSLQARGKPEKILAGISLDHGKIKNVIARYGKPTEVKRWVESPAFNEIPTYDYYWKKGDWTLHLVVSKGPGLIRYEIIDLIEIGGTASIGASGKTGAGLWLGDKISDLVRIYGKRYQEHYVQSEALHEITVTWRNEVSSLSAEFDKSGRITKLSLVGPE